MTAAERVLNAPEARRLLLERSTSGANTTNFFGQKLHERVHVIEETETLLVFSPELDFDRIYYSTADVGELARMLVRCGEGRTAVINHVARALEEGLCAAFDIGGFTRYARYDRMVNRKFRPAVTNRRLDFAVVDDMGELAALIAATFDPFTDHLPDRDDLREIVDRRQALVNRAGKAIDGALLFRLEGKVCNLNYLVSTSTDPLTLLGLLQNFYAVLAELGISRGLLWVDERKHSVIRMHERFGWAADGLSSHYFVRRANASDNS